MPRAGFKARGKILGRRLLAPLGLVILLAAGAWIWVCVSPWPSALVIRIAFDLGGERSNSLLARQVPEGVDVERDQAYDPADPGLRLDAYFPRTSRQTGELLTVVWIHGGGFVAGSKGQVANYAKILAARGYTVVALDYSLAPGKVYPAPMREVNTALAYLVREARRLHVDPARMVLAGDSAGALMAAQLANLITAPGYARTLGIVPALQARQLLAVLLYCGPYDVRTQNGRSPGWFAHAVLWSYMGRRDFRNDPLLPTLRVTHFVTPGFPKSFISVGDADPLATQSYELARALRLQGVEVDTLFFGQPEKPALPHEYQFDLRLPQARQALERSVGFLEALH
jgi:acetyl esterase